MKQMDYAPDQIKDVKKVLDILAGMPPTKRQIALLVTESFINGMTAQENLDAAAFGHRGTAINADARAVNE